MMTCLTWKRPLVRCFAQHFLRPLMQQLHLSFQVLSPLPIDLVIVDDCLSPTTAATGAAKRKKRNKSKKAAAPAATTSAAPAVATAGVDDDAVARRNTLKELVSESLAGLELQHAASTEKKIFTEELCQSATKKVGTNCRCALLVSPHFE